MGWLGSVLSFPFRISKKAVGAVIPHNDKVPIVAVGKGVIYPDAYRDYYEALGFDTDFYKNRIIVWERGTSDKQKEKTLLELQKVV